MSKVLSALMLIWAGYTAALVLGGLVCLIFKIAMTFFTIWLNLVGLMVCIVVAHAIFSIFTGKKEVKDE